MQLNPILACSVAVLASMMAGPLRCRAQYPEDFHQYTVDASGGWTGVHGADKQNFGAFPVYQVGGGIALVPRKKPETTYTNANNPTFSHRNVYMAGDFLYGESDFKGSLQQIINSNPQRPSLLSATAGTGRFYSTTLGPRIQYSWKVFSVYGQGGGGWLQRSLDLTGPSTEGAGLHPTNPSVFGQTGNSGALRLRAGIAGGVKGVRGFVELGFLQGFAINHGTMLGPILSGGVRW